VVLFGDGVQERELVVGEERVWNPDLLGEVASQGDVVSVVVGERQTLVLPVLVQIDRDRVILDKKSVALCTLCVTASRDTDADS